MKELIRQFKSAIKEIQTDIASLKDPKVVSKRISLEQEHYLLKNQQPVKLVIGKKQHVPDILYIERMSYQGVAPWGRSALESDIMQNAKSLYFVLYDGYAPVGFLGAREETDDIHITNIAIVPDYQQIGAATLLLMMLEEFALTENIPSISLEVRVSNQKAKSLYEKIGFRSVRIKKHYYNGDGEDALEMNWLLPIAGPEEREKRNADEYH